MEILKAIRCIYCGKGYGLVYCSGIECPVCVHLKCMKKIVNGVVEKDKFYCAYCCCKRELSLFAEMVRKKEMAEKNLESFLCFNLGSCSDENGVARKFVSDKNAGEDGVEENAGEEDGVGGNVAEEDGVEENAGGEDGVKENTGEVNGGGVCKLVSDDGGVCVGGDVSSGDEKNDGFILVGDDDDEENDGDDNVKGNDQKGDENVVEGEKEVETNLMSSREGGGDESISDWDSETLAVYSRHRRRKKSPMPLQSVPPVAKPSRGQKISKRKLIKETKAGIPEKLKKSEECPIKTTSTQVASPKRKRLYWTAEEEDILKEGVFKFSSKINKNIPWRNILDFGRHIFDSGRTPADLKDKWKTLNR